MRDAKTADPWCGTVAALAKIDPATNLGSHRLMPGAQRHGKGRADPRHEADGGMSESRYAGAASSLLD
jgi:hypothetical protein